MILGVVIGTFILMHREGMSCADMYPCALTGKFAPNVDIVLKQATFDGVSIREFCWCWRQDSLPS